MDRLVLGTVQLGLRYGLAAECPSIAVVDEILDRAWGLGLRRFDCAVGYGVAEERLGDWIRRRDLHQDASIVTKISMLEKNVSDQNKASTVRRSINDSMRRLGVESLEACLVHHADDILYDVVHDTLESAMFQGHIRGYGASCYDPEEVIVAREACPNARIFQLPASFLDQRYGRHPTSALARNGSIAVTLRSTMLQGVAAMSPYELPSYLADLAGPLAAAQDVAQTLGVSPAGFCTAYVLNRYPEASVTFGVLDASQLTLVDEVQALGQIDPGVLDELDARIGDISSSLIDPRQWPKR